MQIVDTHAHLDMSHFDRDRDDAITRAVSAGVTRIVNVGVDLTSSRSALELAARRPEVMPAVGIHPGEASGVSQADIATLATLAQHPQVVAIGEIGLDFYRNYAPRQAQLDALQWQLELAAREGLPVVIHARQAEQEMVAILRNWTSNFGPDGDRSRGVIHCFNGGEAAMKAYVDMGFHISLGAYVGYPTSAHSYDTIRAIPDERLLLETDSPFLPPQSHRGKRNEPAYLPIILETLSRIRNVSPETLARRTSENALRLFKPRSS